MGEVSMPPRVYGPDPIDAQAVRQITHAFTTAFGGPMGRHDPAVSALIEDGDYLAPYMAEAARRHPGVQINGAQVNGLRLRGPGLVEVRYGIQLGHMSAPVSFQGKAVQRDGRWLVSQDTMAQHLALGGVQLPPPE
jgi:hypothetical protein